MHTKTYRFLALSHTPTQIHKSIKILGRNLNRLIWWKSRYFWSSLTLLFLLHVHHAECVSVSLHTFYEWIRNLEWMIGKYNQPIHWILSVFLSVLPILSLKCPAVLRLNYLKDTVKNNCRAERETIGIDKSWLFLCPVIRNLQRYGFE